MFVGLGEACTCVHRYDRTSKLEACNKEKLLRFNLACQTPTSASKIVVKLSVSSKGRRNTYPFIGEQMVGGGS